MTTPLLLNKVATATKMFGDASLPNVRRIERLFDRYRQTKTGLRYIQVGKERCTTSEWIEQYIYSATTIAPPISSHKKEATKEAPKQKQKKINLPWE